MKYLFKQPLFYTSLLALLALGLVIGNYAFGNDWHTPTSIPPLGNVNLTSSYESTITAGTSAQYWRGDKTWQTLNSTAVGLGNVTNESKATMFTSPTFTGSVTMSGALAMGANKITGLGTPTVGTDAATASYIDSALNAKANLASPSFTGTVTIPTPFTLGAVSVTPTGTELNFVDGVTSNIQTQFTGKANLASPTFTGTVTVPTPTTSTAAATKSYADSLVVGFAPLASPTFTGTVTVPTLSVTGAITAPEGTLRDDAGGWVRTYGATGWYSQTYGGGWYMTDTTYIRNYGTKEVLLTANITGPGFFYSSDETLKKNIQEIETPLAKIMKLNGISFDWKESGNKSIGLIAQDVEKVFPEIVKTDKETGLKSIEYAKLVAPLIEAIKEQQKMIDEQRELIDQQGEEIKALKVSFGQL